MYSELFSYKYLVEKLGKPSFIQPIILTESPKTAADVTRLFCCSLSEVIKTLIVGNKKNEYVLVSLRGDTQVDLKKVSEATGILNLILVNDKKIIEKITGLIVGGITPFLEPNNATNITKIILDIAVLELTHINIGSGVAEIGFKLSTKDLKSAWPGMIADVKISK